jgi:hypothetical protein
VTNSAGGGNFTLIASAGASEARISHAQVLEFIVGSLDVPDLKKIWKTKPEGCHQRMGSSGHSSIHKQGEKGLIQPLVAAQHASGVG